MTRAEFDALIADASPSVKSSARTALKESYEDQDRRKTSSPEPQCVVRNESVAASKSEKAHPGIILVRVTSYRRRLLDTDNLVPKWHLDCVRYCGLIKDDNPGEIDFACSQIKVRKKEEERTEIEIEYPDFDQTS